MSLPFAMAGLHIHSHSQFPLPPQLQFQVPVALLSHTHQHFLVSPSHTSSLTTVAILTHSTHPSFSIHCPPLVVPPSPPHLPFLPPSPPHLPFLPHSHPPFPLSVHIYSTVLPSLSSLPPLPVQLLPNM